MNNGNEIKKINLKIGSYQVCPIPTGVFALDGGAMFGTVPKILWEKTNPADDKNRILMEARALLLKGDNGLNILIDCGNGGHFIEKYGDKLGSKFAQMYNISQNGPSLEKSLKKHNINFQDITHVILTHLHFDHCGGATAAKNGQLVPTFPNAKYYVQKRNLDNAKNPNVREKASYLPANFEPLIKAEKLTILNGNEKNLLPNISVQVVNGHTQGQQIVIISDEKNALVYCADLIALSSHVKTAWVMGYDLDPLLVIEEKTQLLKQAAEQNWYLYFEHDPYCDAAQVKYNGKDFDVTNRYHLD